MKAFKYNLNNYTDTKYDFAPMGLLMCVLLFVLAIPLYSIGQAVNDTGQIFNDRPIEDFAFKEWSPDKKLDYSDFKGTFDSSKNLSSQISVYVMVYDPKVTDDSLVLRIVARFDKYGSGIDSLKDANKVELKYDRAVFTILEIYARKLRKVLTNTPITSFQDAAFDSLTELNKQEGEQAWADYNAAINGHSSATIDTVAQNDYELTLKQELDSLDEYKKPIVRIKYSKK